MTSYINDIKKKIFFYYFYNRSKIVKNRILLKNGDLIKLNNLNKKPIKKQKSRNIKYIIKC